MIRIAVIDDDKKFCGKLQSRIMEMNSSFEVECFYNVQSFLELAARFDIVIIDIMLEKFNGIDLAVELTAINPSAKIIFVSVERDFFQDVYSAHHTYFLVKPVSDEHLKKAINLSCDAINGQRVYIKHRGETVSIDLNKVAYFEGMLKKTAVHYSDNSEQILPHPLPYIQNLLKNSNFIRVHQSYIINLCYMTAFSQKKIVVKSREIPVSRKYKSATANSVSHFLGNILT